MYGDYFVGKSRSSCMKKLGRKEKDGIELIGAQDQAQAQESRAKS